MVEPHLPPTRIELYLDCWETFGTEEFPVERVRATQTTQADDAPSGRSRGDVQTAVETLVAAGLLERVGEDRYQVRLTPEDELEDWIDDTVSRVSSLHEAVQSARRDRDARVSESDRTAAVDFEGTTYLRLPVAPETTVAEVARALTDTFETDPDHEHVVLTAPADEAAHVQHIADRLCDPDTDRVGSYSLQKVTTEVLGPDPDSLTFRLYLTRSGR
ncbi:hypothetical protein [Halorientalis halophila]|uniref:hypothetical protein n=1 Tax=Halorientalis halophila TaxID=3108499 RepID=UPI00300B680F